jgi:hypothetical protein
MFPVLEYPNNLELPLGKWASGNDNSTTRRMPAALSMFCLRLMSLKLPVYQYQSQVPGHHHHSSTNCRH